MQTYILCPECEHPLRIHFKNVEGQVVCISKYHGTSTKGVLGLPYTVECDCTEGVSEQVQAKKREAEEEQKRHNQAVADYKEEIRLRRKEGYVD